jgi:hypothetical protein
VKMFGERQVHRAREERKHTEHESNNETDEVKKFPGHF